MAVFSRKPALKQSENSCKKLPCTAGEPRSSQYFGSCRQNMKPKVHGSWAESGGSSSQRGSFLEAPPILMIPVECDLILSVVSLHLLRLA